MRKGWTGAHCSVCDQDFRIEAIWLEIANDFHERKQEHINYRCPNNKDHFKILRQREAANVPKEIRQKVLDQLREGKTIGQIRTDLNLSLDVTCEIITQNIEDIPILRREAI